MNSKCMSKQTLCWDCKNALAGCSWSTNFKPVKGWLAKKVIKKEGESYAVFECPQFVRDAYNNGLKRLPKDYAQNNA